MNKSILIKNASSIVTCDANDRVYHNSDILIEGPKIIRIGKAIQETSKFGRNMVHFAKGGQTAAAPGQPARSVRGFQNQ